MLAGHILKKLSLRTSVRMRPNMRTQAQAPALALTLTRPRTRRMSEVEPWKKDMMNGFLGMVACLVIAVPMIMYKHRIALDAAKNKMD